MARAMMALLMLALLLCVLVSSFEDVFALEDAWTTSGVGDFGDFMPFSIKGMIREYIRGAKSAFDHMVYKSTLRLRSECRVLLAGIVLSAEF